MIYSNLFEKPSQVKAKRTKAGFANPRYVTAVRAALQARIDQDDLHGTYRQLSQAQIKREYTPEKVEALLAAGNENLARMKGPAGHPSLLSEE